MKKHGCCNAFLDELFHSMWLSFTSCILYNLLPLAYMVFNGNAWFQHVVESYNFCRYPYGGTSLGLPERTNEAASQYAKKCLEVAAECGIPAINLWERMQHIPDWKKACLRFSSSYDLSSQPGKKLHTQVFQLVVILALLNAVMVCTSPRKATSLYLWRWLRCWLKHK